ncbi:MAG: hypothetical protein QF464_19170, partial [Myxococcota bacterium]|nr:hypothetical protein [Myxococcota bacterium]
MVNTSKGLTEATWELLDVQRQGDKQTQSMSTKTIHKFVDTWIWAQNARRFKGYSWLYGSDFHGIERGRVGAGSFNRSGWLHKREPMFETKTRVRVEDMKILRTGDTAVVLFEQHRAHGPRSDRGLRELRLGLEKGRVVIAREETLYALAH